MKTTCTSWDGRLMDCRPCVMVDVMGSNMNSMSITFSTV